MPGTGKSRLGKSLARELQVPFTDLDTWIEARAKKTITEIFRDAGETGFRNLEAEALKSFSASGIPGVCATGGGTPCFFNQISLMNETGHTIYIYMDAEKLLKRLMYPTKRARPMWSELNENEAREMLETLYSRRIADYQQAQIHVRLVDNYKTDLQRLLEVIKSIYC